MNKLEREIDALIIKAVDRDNKDEFEMLMNIAGILSDCESLIYGAAAMGFFSERFDSSKDHKELCRKFDGLNE